MSKILINLFVFLLSINYAVGRGTRAPLKQKFPSIRHILKCRLCEFLVYEIQKGVETQSEKIVNSVIQDCEEATRFLGVDCDSLVKEIVPNMSYLLKKLSPLKICDGLQFCDSESLLLNDTITGYPREMRWDREQGDLHNVIGDGEEYSCPVCEGAVGLLHDVASSKDTWPDVLRLLNSSCRLARSESQCYDFVNHLTFSDGQQIVDEYLNRRVVCKLLGLCHEEKLQEHETGSSKNASEGTQRSMRNTGSAKCELCDGLARVGQGIINKHTETLLDLLKQRFTGVCKQLASSLQSECNREVTDILPPMMLEIFRDAIDPGILCVYIFGCQE